MSPSTVERPHAAAPRGGSLRQAGVSAPLGQYLRQAWERRDFAIEMGLSEARSRHVDTVLGNVWHLLNPLMLAAVYFLIFGVVFGARDAHPNYIGFLVIGVFLFTFTRKSTTSGASAIINNLRLIQSIYFPRVMLPVSAVLAELIAHLGALVVVAVFVVVTGEPITWFWLLVIPVTLLQFTFNIGLAMITARMTTRFRDIERLLPFLARIWFYMSGVLYSLDLIEDTLGTATRKLFELNPAYVYIHLVRDALLDQRTEARFWLLAIAWGVATLAFGLVFFRRAEAEYSVG